MTKLLITGSREASNRMIDVAVKAVHRAKLLDWEIIVGDASGIDTCVIRICDELRVPVTVYGGYNKIRNRSKFGKNIPLDQTYVQRDAYMAGECDKCYAIWNGVSRGTKLTYQMALDLHKECWRFTDK